MNNIVNSETESREFLARIARSNLFERFSEAFRLTMDCALRLVRDEQHQHGKASAPFFVTELCVPVQLNGRSVLHICSEPVRVSDGKSATFESVSPQMLKDGSSAADIRAAQRWYDKIPVISAERAKAMETMLQLFAAQLGEYADKLFLQTVDTEPEAVRRARQFILAQLTEPLALEDVARHAGVSPFHFCKIFKRATGLTFTEFVNKARVEQAKHLLLKPQARITEIAYDVGFQSLSQFNRSFRRVTAESPTQYRDHLRHLALVAA